MTETRSKYIQPVVLAVVIGIFSAAGGIIYQHSEQILNLQRDLTSTQKRIYRLRMRALDYHNRFIRSEIQMLELERSKAGVLSVVAQSRLAFLRDLLEQIQEEKTQVIEEGVTNG